MSTRDVVLAVTATGVLSFIAGMFMINFILGLIVGGLIFAIGGFIVLGAGRDEGWFE